MKAKAAKPKTRVAYGLGAGTALNDAAAFADVVDELEDRGWDSLWLSERAGGPSPAPLIGLAVAAGRTRRLKLGTSVLVLPGRNPVLLAKELATLDRLSNGRMLPAVGLGAPDPVEHRAFGVERGERARLFDSMLPLMRDLWAGKDVDGIQIDVRPVQDPFDIWLGGIAPSELRRVGRLGDGWLPSFVTPEDAAEARPTVVDAAREAGRHIDDEHWGALVLYAPGGLPDRFAAALAERRPGVDPARVVPSTLAELRALFEGFIEHGFTKLVVVPLTDGLPPSAVGDAVLDLQR